MIYSLLRKPGTAELQLRGALKFVLNGYRTHVGQITKKGRLWIMARMNLGEFKKTGDLSVGISLTDLFPYFQQQSLLRTNLSIPLDQPVLIQLIPSYRTPINFAGSV